LKTPHGARNANVGAFNDQIVGTDRALLGRIQEASLSELGEQGQGNCRRYRETCRR
jgi:hypothetical protein